MFLRGLVPVHLKFVVAYRKNLGKCLIFFWSKSPWQPLRIRECRGDVCSEDAKATLSPLQVSGHALLSLPQPDSWVSRQILNAFPRACIALTPAARLALPVSLLYGRLRPTSCWKIYQCQSPSLRTLEKFQRMSALPNIKHNRAVLFLRQMY